MWFLKRAKSRKSTTTTPPPKKEPFVIEATSSYSYHTETTSVVDEFAFGERPANQPFAPIPLSASTRFLTGTRASYTRVSPVSKRKQKKKQLFQDLLEESLHASVEAKEEHEGEGNTQISYMPWDWGLHYFWGSPLLIQLYAVVFAAIILRSFLVLHGIHSVLVGHMAARAVVWGVHITASKDFADACDLVHRATHRAMDEAERAIGGDNFRIWIAGASTLAWTKVGKSLVYQILREQYHAINEAVLNENKAKLEQNSNLHE
jgi:hypothetical protein